MKSYLSWAFVLMVLTAHAQYVPNNGQAFQFSQISNPAFSGIENYNDLKLGYRYQWTGFGENSPRFINLSFNTRTVQPLDLSYNSLRTSNPTLNRPHGIPRRKRMIHGLSVNLFESEIGVLSSIGGGVGYALNYPLVNDLRLSIGAGAYVENHKLNVSEITVRDPDNDPYYNYLLSNSTSQTDLNVRAGLLLYADKFYFGVSYLPIVFTPIESSELTFEEPFYIGVAHAGYSFQINPDFALKPSVMAMMQVDNTITGDASLKAFIQNKVWAGVTYRSVQSGVAMAGFNFNHLFSLSYAYETSLSKFQQFSGGSHEIVLAMRFNNIKKYHQYLW
jgi:type IX secretion system PorP/SprF family membrane protein